jgi:hypothetical protein
MLKSFTVVRSYIIADPAFGEARKLGAAVGGGCPVRVEVEVASPLVTTVR